MEIERTLAYRNPELIAEWHPKLNQDRTPYNTSYGSGYKAWWILKYVEPETRKVFEFVWQAAVYHRSAGKNCPYLVGKKVFAGFNDLATKCPSLKGQVHPKKNKGLRASDILAFSNKKIWWIYPYDDPNTGKHFDFEWEAAPMTRIRTPGCPFLSNQSLWSGYNDLKTRYPHIASEWNYKRNKKKPEECMPNSREKVWWIYPYDDPNTGKHFDFEWESRITNRVQDDSGCPFLSNNAVFKGYNDLETKSPELAKEWDYQKNGKIYPDMITLFSNKKRWWICPVCEKSWYASPAKRAKGQNCNCLNSGQARFL